MTRRTKVALASCGLTLALAATGLFSWISLEYAAGRDPFAAAAPALTTTAEAAEKVGERRGSASAHAGAVRATDARGGATATPTPISDDAAKTSGAPTAASSGGTATDDGADSSDTSAPDSTASVSSTDTASSSAVPGPAAGESAPVATEIGVTVTVDGSPAGGSAFTTRVTLPVGATAYDALLATGASVNARATAFGTYVAAIDGLAEKEHGGMSGWVYAVSGVEPNTAASNYTLTDGDTMVWTYVNVEY